MDSSGLQEVHQHQQKGWEHVCTALVLVAEFLAVKYSIVWLGWTAGLFLWFAVGSYARHYLGPRYAKVAILASIPLIVAATYYLTKGRPKSDGEMPTVQAQTTPAPQQSQPPSSPATKATPKSKATQSATATGKGDNSTTGAVNQQGNNNTAIVGNNNNVTIQQNGPTIGGGFHEKAPTSLIVQCGSVGAEMDIETARRNPLACFFAMYGTCPVRVIVSGDLILWSFKSWDAGLPIEVNANEVKIGNDLVDRNFAQNAFEVVNKQGEPLFQMIRKNAGTIQINGIFPTGTISQKTGKQILMWVSDEAGIETSSIQPKEWNLRPIFKYPSWKYPGVMAD
jgi:hypothetical protein